MLDLFLQRMFSIEPDSLLTIDNDPSVQRQNHAIEHGAPHEVAYRLTFVRGQSHAVVQRKNRIFSVDSNGACAVFPLHNENNYVY